MPPRRGDNPTEGSLHHAPLQSEPMNRSPVSCATPRSPCASHRSPLLLRLAIHALQIIYKLCKVSEVAAVPIPSCVGGNATADAVTTENDSWPTKSSWWTTIRNAS